MMSDMFDVDFLRRRQSPGKPVIYQYKKRGILKPKLIAYLKERAGDRNIDIGECDIEQAAARIVGYGLISSYLICDVAKQNGLRHWRKNADSILQLIVDEGFSDICLLVPANAPLDEIARWQQVRDRFCVVVEPEISRESLMPILRYLDADRDLTGGASLCEQPECVGLFERLVDLGQLDDLSDVIKAFDAAALACWDPASQAFFPEHYAIEGEARRSTLLYWSLRRFLRSCDSGDLVAFVATAAQRLLELQDGLRLMNEIERASIRLLRDATTEAERMNGVLWTGVLLAWRTGEADEARRLSLLRSGTDRTIVRLEQAARDHLERASDAGAEDALRSLWPLLRRHGAWVAAASDDELGGARFHLPVALARHLAIGQAPKRPAWLVRLHAWALEIDAAATRTDDELEALS